MSILSDQQLAQNVEDRKSAASWIVDLSEQPRSPHFWKCLSEMAAAKVPPKEEPVRAVKNPPAMKDFRARQFEEDERLPYGKYAGKPIGQVPKDYLEWLAEGDHFTSELRRYIKSDRFKQRQD